MKGGIPTRPLRSLLAFKFNGSNFLFKALFVQNEGHNLDFLESISLLGLCLDVPGHFQSAVKSNFFKVVTPSENTMYGRTHIPFLCWLWPPLTPRKRYTPIPFFSLASHSIPWCPCAGWPVHTCSQSMALFPDTSYHLLAAFEPTYLPLLATWHA